MPKKKAKGKKTAKEEKEKKKDTTKVVEKEKKKETKVVEKEKKKETKVEEKEEKTETKTVDARSLFKEGKFDISSLEKVVTVLKGKEKKRPLCVLKECKKLLLKTFNNDEISSSVMEIMVTSGILPQIVKILGSKNTELQYEAICCCVLISQQNKYKTTLVEAGAIPLLIALLSSPIQTICEEAVWTLGNIVDKTPKFHSLVFDAGIVALLVRLIELDKDSLNMMRACTFTVCNLSFTRGKSNLKQLKQVIVALVKLLKHEHIEIVTFVLSPLCLLSTCTDEDDLEIFIQAGVCKAIVSLFNNLPHTLSKKRKEEISYKIVCTLGNIVAGSNEQTQVVLEAGIIPLLKKLLLTTRDTDVKKYTLWTVSNILAGTQEQIDAVFAEGFVPLIIEHLDKGKLDAKREAAYAIYNTLDNGTEEHIRSFIASGVFPPLCKLLTCRQKKTISVVLKIIDNFCQLGLLESYEYAYLRPLQEHKNEKIREQATKIIDTYFTDGK